jgi:(heptosyl)LPS beta-1,4-glucosyltransferase
MMLRRASFLFLLLFVFTSTFSIALSQLSLGIGVVLFLTAAIKDRRSPFIRELKWLWIAIGLYLAWLMLVCLLQDDPARAVDHIREDWLFLIVPLAAAQLAKDKRLESTVVVLGAGLLLISVVSMIMVLFGVQYHWPEGLVPVADSAERMRGNFTHALTFGNYAAVGSAFLLTWVLARGRVLAGWSRWVILAGGAAGAVATILTVSRGPILALGLGLVSLVFLTHKGRRWWLLGGIAASVLGFMAMPGLQDRFTRGLSLQLTPDWPGGRLYIWQQSLDMVAGEPLFGVGPGNFSAEYHDRAGESLGKTYYYSHAHNDFIQAAARSGIPGLLTFAFLWLTALGLMWKAKESLADDPARRGAVLAAFLASIVFLASSMTEATFADEEVRALLMLIWAIGLASWYKAARSKTDERRGDSPTT